LDGTTLLEKPNGLSFGALYGLDSKANSVFEIEKEYNATLVLAKKATRNQQFSAELCSKINGTYHKEKAALFLKDAQADYLWRDTKVLEVHPF
jgi:iron complex transport system substrate-binding protein